MMSLELVVRHPDLKPLPDASYPTICLQLSFEHRVRRYTENNSPICSLSINFECVPHSDLEMHTLPLALLTGSIDAYDPTPDLRKTFDWIQQVRSKLSETPFGDQLTIQFHFDPGIPNNILVASVFQAKEIPSLH